MKRDLQIYETKDLNIFKHHYKNRSIDPIIVRHLRRSIEEENLLYIRPLVVNREMEVLDGQHRLEAAKQLNCQVYYIFSDSPNAIKLLNNASKNWKFLDFITYYSDNINYIKFDQFLKKYDLHISCGAAIFDSELSGLSRSAYDFKNGLFIYPIRDEFQHEVANNLLKFWNILREHNMSHLSHYKRKVFIRAFTIFLKCKKMNISIFFEKLTQSLNKLRPFGILREMVHVLLEIYNFRSRDPLNISDIFIK